VNRRDFTAAVMSGVALGGLRPHPRGTAGAPLRIDDARLIETFDALRAFGATPAGGVERLAYGDADLAGRGYLMERMRAAGLAVRIDAAGNIVGRRAGARDDLPPIMMGSHIDSVPDAGAYDGNVGSVSALEAVWSLADAGVATAHPIEVVIFQNEEGGLYGSEAMAGSLAPSELDRTALSGFTLRDGIARIGGDPGRLAEAVRPPGSIHAYLELHVEQGGILDATGDRIGVVEGIVGIEQWDVTVTGSANHAGTTPMDRRRDALLAAARFVDAVHRVALSLPGRQVATVGQLAVEPGAPNVVPGRVALSLEIRDLDAEKILLVFEHVQRESQAIASATTTTFRFSSRELGIKPAPTDPRVRRAIRTAAHDLDLTTRDMPSGAGHDAQSFARVCPIGMLFVPSVGGVSHSPREFTTQADMVHGANVLLNAAVSVDRLAFG